jgi:tetratricopeptide (TPR) repeat protein
MYRFLGRYDDSLRVSRQALDAMRASLGEDNPSLIHPIALVAFGMSLRNEPGAEELIRLGVALQDKGLPADHMERAVGWTFLGIVLMNQSKLPEAERWLRNALELRRKAFRPPNWRLAETAGYLGEVLARGGRREEARPLLEDSAKEYEQVLGRDIALTKDAQARLARWER